MSFLQSGGRGGRGGEERRRGWKEGGRLKYSKQNLTNGVRNFDQGLVFLYFYQGNRGQIEEKHMTHDKTIRKTKGKSAKHNL